MEKDTQGPRLVGVGEAPAAGADQPAVPPGSDLRYPHNALEGFGTGANLDLRVRVAINLLEYSNRYAPVYDEDGDASGLFSPTDAAIDALDVAAALMAEAERRGWVAPWDFSGDMTPELRAQALRMGAFGMMQQVGAAKCAEDERARVVPLAPGAKLHS